MRTITRGSYNGHNYYKVDGYSMPSPSKIKLEAPFLDRYHATESINAIDDIWDELEPLGAADRRARMMPAVLDRYSLAAERGRECHRIMEALVNGEPAETSDPTILADAESAARTLDQWQLQPIAAEQALINTDYWYSGTADVIATSPLLGGVFILDYKFGREIYPDFALQQSAYAHSTNTIIEVPQTGPKGGKLKSLYQLGDIPAIRTDQAFLLHTTGGRSRLVQGDIGGWAWDAVQAWIEAWWAYKPNSDGVWQPAESLPATNTTDEQPDF